MPRWEDAKVNGVLTPTERYSVEFEFRVPRCGFGEAVSTVEMVGEVCHATSGRNQSTRIDEPVVDTTPPTAPTPSDRLGFVPAVLGVIR